jgi:hypothetical protein
VVLLTLGVAAGSLVPLQATVRQERAPAHLLARVVGLSTATIPVAAPVGALATGLLIDALGTDRALLLTTGAALLVGAVAVTSRGTRDLDPQRAPRPHRNRWAASSTRATCACQS